MNAEREHWLHITDDPDWERQHIHDPNIPADETLKAITDPFPPDPKRILEIGCGTGRLMRLVRCLYPFASFTGIDINHKVLPKTKSPNEHYLCRDNLIDLDGFDAVYSVAVFQHLPYDEQYAYIAEAFDALTPRGVLRVQFIDGEDSGHLCDHKTPTGTMVRWFREIGFATNVDLGLAHPLWSWITGTK
jgi:trans-aconitate methyltransferase